MAMDKFIKNCDAIIIDKDFNEVVTIEVDKQVLNRNFKYDNGFSLNLTNKIFIDSGYPVDEYCYFKINNIYYKIIYMEEMITHTVCYCYECEVINDENI